MGREIERKFLIADESWRTAVSHTRRYRQAYLARGDLASVRIRLDKDSAVLTIKGAGPGIERAEYEYVIPHADAGEILALCSGEVVEKTRHFLHHGKHDWIVDEFTGRNRGLVVAELELQEVRESFTRPPWLGDEVSSDRRYYNAFLSHTPYCEW